MGRVEFIVEVAGKQVARIAAQRGQLERYVSFGYGPHFCIGNELARMELRTFYRELFRLLPDIDLAGDVVWAGHPFLDPVDSLPCSYTPNPAAAAR